MKELFDKLYTGSEKDFFLYAENALKQEEKLFIVTANPETMMIAEQNQEFGDALRDNDTVIIPDGIGVIKAAGMLGKKTNGRITGCDLAAHLIEEAERQKKSLYLYGAKEEVVSALAEKIKIEYPGARIAGFCNGYNQEDDEVFEEIARLKPDIVFVALGIPRQELVIYRHLDCFVKGIFVGVGGSFDVLSGKKKRAPRLFQKLNLEWFYRIVTEPKRIGRFYRSNVKFLGRVRKVKKQIKKECKKA